MNITNITLTHRWLSQVVFLQSLMLKETKKNMKMTDAPNKSWGSIPVCPYWADMAVTKEKKK